MDFREGLTSAWSSVANFVPKFVLFLVVLGVGYVIAKVLSTAISKLLTRVGFDKAVERGGIRKFMARSQYDASDVLAKLVFYTVMLFVLQLAFNSFGSNNAVSQLLSSVTSYLPKVIAALVIIVVASAIGTAVREIVDVALSTRSYGRTMANIAGGVFVAVGIFAALDQLQIASTITNAIFYAILAALVGVTIVAVGGAGVRPMQGVWEKSIARVTDETRAVSRESGDTKQRLADRMDERREQMRGEQTTTEGDEAGSRYADVRETPAYTGARSTTESPLWSEQQRNEQPRNEQPRGGQSNGGSAGAPRRPQGF